ncbi:hypothetical protein Tco_0233388 [Tanacetum coccineum]
MVSPFLCSDDSESDTEIPERHVSPIPHDAMLTNGRPTILIRPSEDIPIGRLYRTHPGGPCRALTVRKLVRPLPSHHLALRYTSHHLDRFTSGSSSNHSSSDHSSFGHSISGHYLFGHTSPDTTVAVSSTPPRFVHPPLARTLWCSEAYLRWRSPDAIVTSSIHATRALVPSRAYLLPPCKRFRDSISPEDSVEEEIDKHVGIDLESNVGVDVETRAFGGELESRSLIAGRERVGLLEQVASLERSNNMTITRSGMTPEVIEELINRRVEEALAIYEAILAANALEAKSQSQNGSDGNNRNGGNGNGGNRNPNENNRGDRPVAQECTYQDFMKCQSLNFKGMEGVVGLIRWFEKIETVFHISNCSEKYQVKYVTCTLSNSALTWWNLHKRTIRTDVAFSMTWRELMKLMVEVYYPRTKIQKMEQ